MTTDFSGNWQDLSGNDLWSDLIDPVTSIPDESLRRYIIHYGERTGAVDDLVIDGKLVSPTKTSHVGLPRYSKEELFEKVGLVKGNAYTYEKTEMLISKAAYKQKQTHSKYIYGTLPNRNSNLLAYVAVSDDEGTKMLGRKDILIAWRGARLTEEAVVDKDDKLIPATLVFHDHPNVKLHSGWYHYYTKSDRRSPKNAKHSCRDQVLKAVKELMDQYDGEASDLSIIITGRGLGAALGLMNLVDIVKNGFNKLKDGEECLVTGFLFGCPKVGNKDFVQMAKDQQMSQILRIANDLDPMIRFPDKHDYQHVGEELRINSILSSDLKKVETIKQKENARELEVYLHGVGGQRGLKNARFEWKGIRDITMVNKILNCVDDKHKIPAKWILHRFMEQDESGNWELKDDPKEDDDA